MAEEYGIKFDEDGKEFSDFFELYGSPDKSELFVVVKEDWQKEETCVILSESKAIKVRDFLLKLYPKE